MNPEDLLRIVFALGLEHRIKLVHPYYHLSVSSTNSSYNYDLLLVYAEKNGLTYVDRQSDLYIRIPVEHGTINSSVLTSPQTVADALGLTRTNSNQGLLSVRALWNPSNFISSERSTISYQIFATAFMTRIESQHQLCLENGSIEHTMDIRLHF